MRRYTIVLILALGVFLLPCAAFAGNADYAKDEYVFERLLQERVEVFGKYVRALQKGKEELKSTGDIELRSQNAILDLRSRKDRVETRIVSIALRHGWDVPPLSQTDVGRNLDIESRELEKVFGIAKVLVRSELRKDAGRFMTTLTLPAQKVNIKQAN